ncbi:MAG: two-component regulator propeller domain-containing protein [Thermoanaerobaculia bacterium]|jgi:diguanylate cyclase (GGDEF)-like protein
MAMRSYRLAALLVALVLGRLEAPALDPKKALTQYEVQTWGTDSGLPESWATAIHQTRDGYLWIGTQEGLVRFDGVRFTVYDKQTTPAMKSQSILCLLESRDGALWIGTGGGGALRYAGGVFTTYGKAEGLPDENVWSLLEDREGRIWIGTASGACKFEGKRIVAAREGGGLLSKSFVLAMSETDGALWFGTDGNGLIRLASDGLRILTTKDGLPDDRVRCLYPEPDGTLWIGTRGGGLGRLRAGRLTRFPTANGAWANIGNSAICRDRNGNLWVGTRGGGLLRLRGEGFEAGGKGVLGSDVISAVLEDREGNLWVGTQGAGLVRMKDGSFTPFGLPEGLRDENLLPVLEDRAGSLWLGSFGGGLFRFSRGSFTGFTTRKGLSSDVVLSLAEGGDGSLWIGTDGGGLNRLKDGRFARFGARQGIPSDRVTAVAEDRRGLWIGTLGGGLARMREGKIERVPPPRDFRKQENVLALTPASDGSLWVGTEGGGASRLLNGEWTVYTKKDGLPGDVVFCILEEAPSVLWIGTENGLARLRDGKLAAVTPREGLFDGGVSQVLNDEDHLWASNNKGVFRVAKAELNDVMDGRGGRLAPRAFGKSDGMRSNECNGGGQPAGWKSRDGRLWFPTVRGVVAVNPRELQVNRLPPPVEVESISVDGKLLAAQPDRTAPPGQGNLEIQYTALSFVDPAKVRFQYRLEGFDADWIDAGTRRVAYYTHTPPAHYRFRVRACNNDGVWSPEGAELSFTLRSHVYQSPWFIALCVAAVGLAGVTTYRRRVRELDRRRVELTGLVAERTHQLEERSRELEEANRVLERLSARDGLTSVANRRHFDEVLGREWRRAVRERSALSLVLADVDHFKMYNDKYGHLRGDDCLKTLAETLAGSLSRPSDLCARYGGEEFAMILPNTEEAGAMKVGERLRHAVEERRLEHASSPTAGHVTVSVGVATVRPLDDGGDPLALVAAADVALYEAKESGRNRTCSKSVSRL